MDEVSLEQLLLALENNAFKEHAHHILQVLCERVNSTNLSSEHMILLSSKILKDVISPSNKHLVNLLLILLCNLTISESNAQCFLDSMKDDSWKRFHVAINRFLDYNPQLEDTSCSDWDNLDPWQHIGSVLCNLCQIEAGRKILLQKSTGYMKKLIVQFRSRNPTRARGAIASFRSCIFDKDVHWWVVDELDALTPLLLPLATYSKEKFTDEERVNMDPLLWMAAQNSRPLSSLIEELQDGTDIFQLILESIVLLCQTRGVRMILRHKKVYLIVRNFDYAVNDISSEDLISIKETLSNWVFEIVNFLKRDEDPDTPLEVPMVESVFHAKMLSTSDVDHVPSNDMEMMSKTTQTNVDEVD